MTVAPPRPPSPAELEALIREARARQQRRRLVVAAVVAVGAGVGLATWAAMGDGAHAVRVRGHGPIRGVVGRVAGPTSLARRGIGEVGSAGGITWAISGRGFWLTANDGRTWRHSILPHLASGGVAGGRGDPIANISDLQFVDRRYGWVAAMGRSRIYRTTDGGRTWRISGLPGCSGVCRGGAIDFLDTRRGYALVETPARNNRLFWTENGGRTWRLVSRPTVYGRITFLNRATGFAFGGNPQMILGPYKGPELGYLYETTDGGRTWSRFDPAGSGSFVEQPITAGRREVLVVENGPNPQGGLNLAAATTYVSRDGGRHWSGRTVPFEPYVDVSLSAASPSVWAWAVRQDLFVTDHAGSGWREVSLRGLPRYARIEEIDFVSSRAGWAILSGLGPHRTLFRTSDGGLHWAPAGPRRAKRHRQ